MIDGRTTTNNADETSPPFFDDRASAEAQPVTPIPKSRSTVFKENVRIMFSTGWRAFALVVVLGLATGTLAGMALVRATNRASELTEGSEPTQEAMQMQNADVGAQGLVTTAPGPGAERPRIRMRRSFNRPRAFRVAVLR